MTDNKLTDNEIIKGIECCASRTFRCDECCYAPFKFNECTPHILNDALDLINRLKAEIERLNKEVDAFDVFYFCSYSGCEAASNKCWKTCPNSVYNKTRTEVIKEYREKAAIKLAQNARSDYWHWIDDTLHEVEKEMVGENNV